MNARGSTVAARLQNIPARVTEIAEHRVHAGIARAIAVVSHMFGVDYWQWDLVFPEQGEAWNAFDELVDDVSLPADAFAADVSLEGVISNLFGEESD